jgi:hypothetical protein
MPQRWIGKATITLFYRRVKPCGRWSYSGRVVAPDADGKLLAWDFDDLNSGTLGIYTPLGEILDPTSDEALDRIAQSAVVFGASITKEEDKDDDRVRVAAAIEEATGSELDVDGNYIVRRSR